MNQRVSFLIVLLLVLAAPAQADRVYLESGVTRDGDVSGHERVMAGYRYRAGDALHWELDLAGGTRGYWEDLPVLVSAPGPGGGSVLREVTEKERFDVARAALRCKTPKVWSFDARLEQLQGDDWDPLLGAANVSARPHPDWYLELFEERELVDTVRAIRERVKVDTYGLSADYSLTPSLVLVGALLAQDFSDGNRREGGIVRLVYYPEKPEWLHLQLKGRILDASRPSDTYFSPERLQEYFLLAGIATPFADDDWIVRLLAGPGLQIIEPFDAAKEEKEAYLAELQLRGWFTDHLTLESNAGCSTAITSSDTYAYCFANLHFGYAW